MNEPIIRALSYEERKYVYMQSPLLLKKCGYIGTLRGDFGNGHGFYTSWTEGDCFWKSEKFSGELDDTVYLLRTGENGILTDRESMKRNVRRFPKAVIDMKYMKEYAIAVLSEDYAYMMRLNPDPGMYNFYVYCFDRKAFFSHLENAKEGIRFIDSRYRTLFNLPDGENIIIRYRDGQKEKKNIRYVDSHHMLMENSIFHICEFAERMEESSCIYKPERHPLPRYCFGIEQGAKNIIRIERYSDSYRVISGFEPLAQEEEKMMRMNALIGVSAPEAKAMMAGLYCGWDSEEAKVSRYEKKEQEILR